MIILSSNIKKRRWIVLIRVGKIVENIKDKCFWLGDKNYKTNKNN
jgi:hypothetical protein